MRHVVVMVATSYPRFPGDSVGTFMEPIAKSVVARGHEVHLVAPWHPLVARREIEDGVRFHFYKYAPIRSLNVFGYAAALRADVKVRGAAYLAAPLALAAGWRAARAVARQHRATVMHGHWVIPGGAIAAAAAPHLPLVVSLHGSDVYLAEKLGPAGRIARAVFRRSGAVTACSADLSDRAIALGADASRMEVVPYGVDPDRFRPDPDMRGRRRASLGIAPTSILLFSAGRLVRKKGFEYLIDALSKLGAMDVVLVLAGDGDLRAELGARADRASVANRVRFLGNVDGLPNVVLEAMASGTPLVTTAAGGIGAVARDDSTAKVVPERDAVSLARAISELGADRALRSRLGEAARTLVVAQFGWNRVAGRFEAAYDRALAMTSPGR